MFLFKIGLSRLISKFSLVSRTNLLFPFAKMVNSSKEGNYCNLKDGRELHSPLMV